MSVFWKLLAVLLLTMPPAAYVAGTVVGPPDRVLAEDRPAPSRPSSEPPTSQSRPDAPVRKLQPPAPQPETGTRIETPRARAPEPREVVPTPDADRDRVLEVHPPRGRPDPRRDEVAGDEAERRGEQGMLVTPEDDPADQPDEGILVDQEPDGPDELEDWAEEEDPDEPLTAVPDGVEIDPAE
jgi:hypothetical protein